MILTASLQISSHWNVVMCTKANKYPSIFSKGSTAVPGSRAPRHTSWTICPKQRQVLRSSANKIALVRPDRTIGGSKLGPEPWFQARLCAWLYTNHFTFSEHSFLTCKNEGDRLKSSTFRAARGPTHQVTFDSIHLLMYAEHFLDPKF